MKKTITFLILCIILSTSLVSCKKKEDTNDEKKTGQVIFSMSSNNGDAYVSLNGETKYFSYYLADPPECGTVSQYCANFIVPAGTYTFEFKCNNGTGPYEVDYPGTHSVTVLEGNCTSVRW